VNPCLYGVTCRDLVNGYRCDCAPGFSGSHCQTVPDFCRPGDCEERNVCYTSLDERDGLCACDSRFFQPGMLSCLSFLSYHQGCISCINYPSNKLSFIRRVLNKSRTRNSLGQRLVVVSYVIFRVFYSLLLSYLFNV